MDMPTRTKQRKAESESYAILLYKLRRLGIFRNMTENDYGIDFEIELVKDQAITGKYFKAQVKSAETLYIREDGVPTVGGIKQSTLAYWCELSFRTHVIAYAVDLTSEDVYVSLPLFWQATKLIDGVGKSKTIEFLSNPTKDTDRLLMSTLIGAMSPSVPDIMYAQTSALRHLRDYFQLYDNITACDPGSVVDRPEVFQSFLEVSRILLWADSARIGLPNEDKNQAYSFDHWARKGGDIYSSEVMNHVALRPMKALMPLLIEALGRYRKRVIDGAYYWTHRDRPFLTLVYDTLLPETTDDTTLSLWAENFDQVARRPTEDVSILVHRVLKNAEDLRAAEVAKKSS